IRHGEHPGGSVVKDELVNPAFNDTGGWPLPAQSVLPNCQRTRNPQQRLGRYEQSGSNVQRAPAPASDPRPAQRDTQVDERHPRHNEQHDQKMHDYDGVSEHLTLGDSSNWPLFLEWYASMQFQPR